jgi:alanyl-tRNA synthetase
MQNDIKEIILSAAVTEDGKKKLSCEKAFELAEKHGIELIEIGRICNQEGIKIAQCQLGCFP